MKTYKLNAVGVEALSAAIKAVAHHPLTINPAAWFDVAEDSAADFEAGEMPVLRIHSNHTTTQATESIILQPHWFDATETELQPNSFFQPV